MAPSIVEENGRKMNLALTAVRDLHRDCSRLLLDIDDWMQKKHWRRFADDDTAARPSNDLKKAFFMAPYLYRRWVFGKQAQAARVQGVFIFLFDKGNDGFLDVPTLIASDFTYHKPVSFKEQRHWDPYHALCDWSGTMAMNQVLEVDSERSGGKVHSGTLIARPLFALTTSTDVEVMLQDIAKVAAALSEL